MKGNFGESDVKLS